MAQAEKNQPCPTNQFNAFGHCYPIGTPSIPNPTSGCGHNGRMCASIPCPSGYEMTPVYINGLLTDFQCANLSNCPSGTVSHNNTCVTIETGQQVPSPIKQIKSGIMIQDVKCKENFVLVIQEANEHPACVKSANLTRFLAHGWITVEKFETNPIPFHITKNMSSSNTFGNKTNISKPQITNYPNSSNITVPLYPEFWETPLSPIQVNPIITTTEPNSIKILSIGMSPNLLHVGDRTSFTVTYQNISNKTLYRWEGCGSTLSYKLSPEENVEKISQSRMGCGVRWSPVQPNQTITDLALAATQYAFYYQVTKSGTLNVNMTLGLSTKAGDLNQELWDIQFNVNATVSTFPCFTCPTSPSIEKPMSITDVVQNLDWLYGKQITVYGYYAPKYPFPVPLHSCRASDPNVKPTYVESAYAPDNMYGGNNFLANTTSHLRGEALELRMTNHTSSFFESSPDSWGKPLTLTGVLEKDYTSDCWSPIYYRSAYLLMNSDQLAK